MKTNGMTKFNIGDKVRVIKEFYEHREGDIAVIDRYDPHDAMFTYGFENYGGWVGAEHIELVDDTNERLTQAEAKIAALEAEVKALKEVTFEKSLEDPLGPLFSQLHKKKTPNQRRADVIQHAKAFVADLERRAETDDRNGDGNWLFNGRTTKLTFHVNAEKGVVTALAHGRYGGKLSDKAFAKCHPNDVFNADIGKAIAAGRLYGVDIPSEFTEAPMPTEVVVGMRVKGNGDKGYYRSTRTFTLTKPRKGGWAYSEEYGSSSGDWIEKRDIGEFTEDTDAVYV